MGAAVAPLVGRSADLSHLVEAAMTARAGTARSVLVTGEAGIGKSRLVAEAVAGIGDALVITGRAAEMSTGEIAFGVLADTLRDLVRTTGADGLTEPERQALAPLLPASSTTSDVDRTALLSAFVALLERLSAERLLVWVVEDLHWADTATRDAVTLAIRTLRGSLLLVATVRTDDPDRPAAADADLVSYVAGLARAPGCEVVALDRLAEDEVRQQLLALMDGQISAAANAHILELSDGIPFVVEELAAASGRPELSTASGVAAGRLAGLTPDAARLVDAAAVGDGHLRISLLEAVVDATPDELDANLGEAVRAGILVVDAAADRVDFRHALLRDAADRAMGPGARRSWHRRWAEVLESTPGVLAADPCVLAVAEHWHQARDVRRAAVAAMSALDALERIGDASQQARLWTRVLATWESYDDPEQALGTSLRHAVATALSFGSGGTTADLVTLLDAVPLHLMTDLEQATLRIAREITGEAKGELARRFRPLVVELFDRFDLTDQPHDLFCVQALTLGSRLPRDDPRGPAAMDLAAEIAVEMGSLPARLLEMSIRSHSRQFAGDPLGAADYLDRQLEELGDLATDDVLYLTGNLMWCRMVGGEHARAQRLGEAALARLRHPQLVVNLWEHLVENHAFSLTCTGAWARARRLLEESAPWWEDDIRNSNLRLAHLDVLQHGTTETARWRSATGTDIPGGAPQLSVRHLLAAAANAGGDVDAARDEYLIAWRDSEMLTMDDFAWLMVVEAARMEADGSMADPDRQDRRAATEHLELVSATAERFRRYGALGEVWPLDLAAQLDRFHGRDARASLEAALAGWDRIGHVPDVAVTHLSLAEAHAAYGDRDEAHRHLAAGREIAERLEAGPMLARAAAIAERYALSVRERRTSDVLTGREAEVLSLVAEGRSNAEIATTLFMSPKTASVHVSHIIAKLGAANRTEAAAMARRQGLLQ